MGVLAGLVAFGVSYATRNHGSGDGLATPAGPGSKLETRGASFVIYPGASGFSVQSNDGASKRGADLSLVVDGVSRAIALGRDEIHVSEDGSLKAVFPIDLGGATTEAQLVFKIDRDNSALLVDLRIKGDAVAEPHSVSLRMEVAPSSPQVVFVSGVGEVADSASVTGSMLVMDSEPHAVGVVSTHGALGVATFIDDPGTPSEMRVTATSPALSLPAPSVSSTDLRVAAGASSMRLWRALFALEGMSTTHVKGRVTGTKDRARVFGRDGQGAPQLRATAADDGTFELDAPQSVIEWYAAIDAARASSVASFTPGTARDLVLDVSPGGALRVTVVDFDTKKPLTARLLVTGIKGTVDPSFGPDYRASGAGPLIDALHGDVETPLPSGKYRVAATKGLEWSVDAQEIEIAAGRTVEVHLEPRHVVPTPGVVGCDLHVHSRPSFDSPVSVEDRVLSLVGAGIDFAVPTEHNVVGDYASAIETFELAHEFASVTGVEITTMGGGFGHFGVFPYPKGETVPPYKHASMGYMIKAARGNDPRRFFQVHHPRLPKGIGYFSDIGFSPTMTRQTLHGRFDFDGIEIYNGFDIEDTGRVEQVLRDYHALLNLGYRHVATGSSDAHRIQYHWAGYPRTMVNLDAGPTGDTIDEKFDPMNVVAAIKKGHAIVTSGPVIELDLGGVHPGDEITTTDDPIKGHLRVRAAPWIDVASVQIILNGKMIQSFPVPSRPTKLGAEDGTLQEAEDRTIRFDEDLSIPVGDQNGWVQIIVRGERKMDDVLPFMPVPPFGFTNPVWITRTPVAPPPLIINGPAIRPASSAGGAAPLPNAPHP